MITIRGGSLLVNHICWTTVQILKAGRFAVWTDNRLPRACTMWKAHVEISYFWRFTVIQCAHCWYCNSAYCFDRLSESGGSRVMLNSHLFQAGVWTAGFWLAERRFWWWDDSSSQPDAKIGRKPKWTNSAGLRKKAELTGWRRSSGGNWSALYRSWCVGATSSRQIIPAATTASIPARRQKLSARRPSEGASDVISPQFLASTRRETGFGDNIMQFAAHCHSQCVPVVMNYRGLRTSSLADQWTQYDWPRTCHWRLNWQFIAIGDAMTLIELPNNVGFHWNMDTAISTTIRVFVVLMQPVWTVAGRSLQTSTAPVVDESVMANL